MKRTHLCRTNILSSIKKSSRTCFTSQTRSYSNAEKWPQLSLLSAGCHCLDQSAPAPVVHYRRSSKTRRGPFPDALTALHRPEFRLSPSLAAALISAENSFIFSPRQTLCAEEFALNFVTAESCGAHAHRCHWRARVQRVKGVQRGEVGGSEGDTKVTFLLIVWTKWQVHWFIYPCDNNTTTCSDLIAPGFWVIILISQKIMEINGLKISKIQHIWSQCKSLTNNAVIIKNVDKISTTVTDYRGKVVNICDGQIATRYLC